MTRTIYYTASSLDGFIATPEHSLEWLLSRDIDPEGPFAHEEFMTGIGATIMGRSTYDWMIDHLATSGEEAWPHDVPSWVMTHRDPGTVPLGDLRFVSGDLAEAHARVVESAGERDVWVVGGGDIAGRLALAGLLDEVIVSYAPVTLGEGAPLLPHHVELRLEGTARNRDFVCARYAVAG